MAPGSWCCPSSGIAKPWQNLGASRALLAPSAPSVPSCGQSWHSGMENRIPHSSRRHPSASINDPVWHLPAHGTISGWDGCERCSPVSRRRNGSRSSKTFKPKKNIPEGSHQYELLKHAEATLGSGNLRQAVMLPEGEDLNEWIAVNTVDFFNQINMLYGTITEFCTEASCPVMSAGPRYEYHWADGTNIKKPIKCSAPKYIDYLMTWVQDQLDDETLFPSKIGVPFPKNFMSVAKTILKRLFRVYAHIYHQHFDSVMRLQEEAHLNTSFKHFIFFVQEFNLIDRRELAPLQELIEKLGSKDR
ncbi:MOB kinase activator 1A isoform 1-T1 [Sarcoramphus papa]